MSETLVRRMVRMGFVVLVGVCGLTAEANFPIGTYVIAGLAKDAFGMCYAASDNVKVQARAADGEILAAATVANPYGEANARNFSLSVPLTTVATKQSAAVGDKVWLSLVVDGMCDVSERPVALTRANGGTNLVLQVADTISYTNVVGGVTNTAVVTRGYVEAIQPWLDAFAETEEDRQYKPFADYDGDGRSNYREYVEGTDPFDETDYLRIEDFSAVEPKKYAITFVFSGRRVYAVSAASSLAKPAWLEKKIRLEPQGKEQERAVFEEADDEALGVRTLYVVPAEDATSEFFKIEVE